MLDFQNLVYLIVILLFLCVTIYRVYCYRIYRNHKVAELQDQIAKYQQYIYFEMSFDKFNRQMLAYLVDEIIELLKIIGYEKYGDNIDLCLENLRRALVSEPFQTNQPLINNDQADFIKTFPEVMLLLLMAIIRKEYLTDNNLDVKNLINDKISHIKVAAKFNSYFPYLQNLGRFKKLSESNKYA